MKSIPLLLMMLLIVGCSNDWGTNSSEQDVNPASIAQNQAGSNDPMPVRDIEPTTPLCESQQFGFVTLQNPTAYTVRCVVGTDHSINVQPGRATYLQLPMGIHELQWWPTDRSFYETSVIVNVCKTSATSFDPSHACKFASIN